MVVAVSIAVVAAQAAPGSPSTRTQGAIESRIDTIAMRIDTRILAHDSMAGRVTGSSGARMAAAYIAERLRSIGLDPAAGNDYYQPVPLREARFEPGTYLRLLSATDTLVFEPGRDFVPGPGTAGAFRDFAGPVVFAGTADHAGEALGGVDVGGRVIVLAGSLGENADSLVRFWTAARAAGILLLIPDRTVLANLGRDLGPDRFYVDARVDEPRWQNPLPTLYAGPRIIRALLREVTLPPGVLDSGAFDAMALRWTIDASAAVAIDQVDGSNVVALLPGTDPRLRDEYVLFAAHYDHLGIGEPEDGDSIYNGFSDNAAGVAMLLAIAEAMHRAPPARSIVFLFTIGEEKGLLGSSYFAAFPTLPLGRFRAVINLDGGAPPRPPVTWRVAGGLESELGESAREVAAGHGWAVQLTGPRANSDHWPFHARGVPSIFLIPGEEWEGTTVAGRDSLRSRFDHYHRPGDEWRADFPFAGLQRYAALALEIGLAAASARHEPDR